MSRVLKLALFAAVAVALFRYVPVYYHTMEFNRYVQQQVPRIRSRAPLKEAILSKAEEHSLNVAAEDINMTESDSVLRVSVEYHVPVDFYVFHQDLKFNAAGSGLLMTRSN